MLTEAQQTQRDGKVTASFLPYLMAGDEAKIMSEWRRIVGDPAYEPEDLSDVWAVQLGSYLETFSLDWYERKSGHVLNRRGVVSTHPEMDYVVATLDAYRADDNCVIDCKVVGHWRKIDDVCSLYTPQMVVQKACAKAERASLLIVHGGAEPAEYPIEWDWDYETQVWARIGWFYSHVETLTPPVATAPIAAPVKAIRTADLTGNNLWADAAADWLSNGAAAKTFDKAAKSIKSMVEPDVSKAHGHGIVVSRSGNGALTIKGGKL